MEMKIIFLNTWRGELRDELRAYVHRHIGDTEVFCFQEADDANRSAYEDLLEDDYKLHTAQRQESDGSWFGNAIYVRNDLAIVDTGGIFLESKPDFIVGIAAYVTLEADNGKLTICNVHGISQPGHKLDTPERLYQSHEIIETLKGHEAVIVGGDFNLLPETQSVQTFTEHGYRSLITDYDIKSTRNRITYERYPNSIQYFADYAFVSPRVKVVDFVVPTDVVSDHQPLELTIADAL